MGFSTEVSQRMAKPQRKSTQKQYKSRMNIFWDWCKSNQVSKSRPPPTKVAEFFQYLYYDRKRLPRTIQGYRTTLSNFYSTSMLDLGSRRFTNLIRSYIRDRPPALRSLPLWDLGSSSGLVQKASLRTYVGRKP